MSRFRLGGLLAVLSLGNLVFAPDCLAAKSLVLAGETPVPTVTPTATPCSNIVFSENFDQMVPPNLSPGWGANGWVVSNVDPDTPPNDAFVDDPAFVTDRALDTPSIVLPSASAVLSFRNNFNTESSGGVFWDGGVLEISSPNINGGIFTDITDPTVGASFMSGGYTGTISDLAGNPLADRAAWSGNSSGYISTVVNLGSNVSGQTIKLRFRMGTDSGGSAFPGWRIDTIIITGGPCGTPTPTPTATPTASPSATPTAAPTATATVGPTATPSATPSPTPVPFTHAVNLSTRMQVQAGDGVGIGGFIITGTEPKTVLLRAIGPSLFSSGIPNLLANPVLELRQNCPEICIPELIVIVNDNWRDTQEAAIKDTGIAPTNDLESAIIATLPPGPYTALVRGKDNTTGVGLVEVYDLGHEAGSRLANLSTRAIVSTGDNIVIAGFLLKDHGGSDQLVLRGIGPSLAPGSFPASAVLANPTLDLRDGNGGLVITNNDWQDNPEQAAEISARGLAPTNNLESGIAATLPPGLYTALLAGLHGGTGIGLVEVYDLGP
jgi:hypothetical protein